MPAVHISDAQWSLQVPIYMSTGITVRGGVFYFRARIPTHLISDYGRAIVSVSLRTRDPAEAKRLARERRVELDKELEVLERGHPQPDAESGGSVLFLSDADIEHFCLRYQADLLARDELERINGLAAHLQEFDIDVLEYSLPGMKQAYARGELTPIVKEELQVQMRRHKLRLPPSAPSYQRLALAFQRAQIAAYENRLARRRGEVTTPPDAPQGTLSLDAVVSIWKRHKGMNPKSVRSFEQAFEMFKARCETSNATLVRKADAIAFRDALMDDGSIKPATIRKLLGFLRAAFQCAVDDDKIPLNPFSGVKVTVPKTASSEKPRLPFTMEELAKIFNGPVYQAGYRPRESLGSACYWLPLLSLFSGARVEELAQLEKADVEHSAEHGHHICIRRSTDRSKRTKNLNSVRNFPVHPELVDLGFIDFVDSAKPGRLFPALRSDKYGVLSTSFSTWFGLYLDKLGIRDRTKVFHSFRHNFIQRCKEKSNVIPSEVREAIVGHLSASKIEIVYGCALYPLAPQAAAMRHVDFPGLDLAPLKAV